MCFQNFYIILIAIIYFWFHWEIEIKIYSKLKIMGFSVSFIYQYSYRFLRFPWKSLFILEYFIFLLENYQESITIKLNQFNKNVYLLYKAIYFSICRIQFLHFFNGTKLKIWTLPYISQYKEFMDEIFERKWITVIFKIVV